MPEFATAFSTKTADRKLSLSELIRGVRFNVAAEYEAVQIYMELAESTDNEKAKAVLIDIANEERVHAGEFLRLLKDLAPDEEGFYQSGAAEVEQLFAEIGSANESSGREESTIGSLKK